MYIYIYAPYVRLTVYFYLQQRQQLRRSIERETEMGMRLLTSLPNNGGGGELVNTSEGGGYPVHSKEFGSAC